MAATTDSVKKSELIAIRLPDGDDYFGDRTVDDGKAANNKETVTSTWVTKNGTTIKKSINQMKKTQATKTIKGKTINKSTGYTSKAYTGISEPSRLVSSWFSNPAAQADEWTFTPTSAGKIIAKGTLKSGESTYVMVYYRHYQKN